MKTISVLVAVYNAESTLNKCLDSLLTQTYPALDIICVDDASTDESPNILEQYAARDQRVQVIHNGVNSGAPHARNIALQQAHGELICYLDSDDWLATDAIERCVKVFDQAPDVDCVLFNVKLYDPKKQSFTPYPSPPLQYLISGKEAFQRSLNWQLHGIYMVRAEIHKRIPYDDSCQLYSDDNTTRLHYLAARQVGQTDGTYFYRQHADSATHQVSAKRYQYVDAARHLAELLKDMDIEEKYLRTYETTRWRILVDTYKFHYCHRKQLTEQERNQGLEKIHREWQSIHTEWVSPSLRRKFGYIPLKTSWTLFQWQEETYFFLRSLLGKNKE